MDLTRKRFIELFSGASALLFLQGCGGGSDYNGAPAPAPAPGPAPAPASGCSDVISGNHGHVLTVSVADLDSMTAKTYDIMGGADHPHMVTVTAANFTSLKNNPTGSVQVTSTSTFAHTHTITITCM